MPRSISSFWKRSMSSTEDSWYGELTRIPRDEIYFRGFERRQQFTTRRASAIESFTPPSINVLEHRYSHERSGYSWQASSTSLTIFPVVGIRACCRCLSLRRSGKLPGAGGFLPWPGARCPATMPLVDNVACFGEIARPSDRAECAAPPLRDRNQ